MADNQRRSIWDVFSDVKSDSNGNDSIQSPTIFNEDFGTGGKIEFPLMAASAEGSKSQCDTKITKSGVLTEEHTEEKSLTEPTRKRMLPSFKLNELRSRLKFGSGATGDKNKVDKKVKSPSPKTRGNSDSTSPVKKTALRGVEKAKELFRPSDIRTKLDNILKRNVNSNKTAKTKPCAGASADESAGEAESSSSPTNVNNSDAGQALNAYRTPSVTPPDKEPGTSSPAAASAAVHEPKLTDTDTTSTPGSDTITGVVKFSKREKRRPVKYSPEITRAPIPRQRGKSAESDKKAGKPKARRSVDFSKTSPATKPVNSKKPCGDKVNKTVEKKETRKSSVGSKAKSPNSSFVGGDSPEKSPASGAPPCTDPSERDTTPAKPNSTQDNETECKESEAKTKSCDVNDADNIMQETHISMQMSEMAMKTMPPTTAPSCAHQVEVERLPNVPVQNLHRSILQGRCAPLAEHRTHSRPRSVCSHGVDAKAELENQYDFNDSPTIIDLTAQCDGDELPAGLPREGPHGKLVSDLDMASSVESEKDSSSVEFVGLSEPDFTGNCEEGVKKTSGLMYVEVDGESWSCKEVGMNEPTLTGRLKDVKNESGVVSAAKTVASAHGGSGSRDSCMAALSCGTVAKVKDATIDNVRGPQSEEACAPLDLSKAPKNEPVSILEVDFDKPLDLSVKRRPSVSTPAPGVAYEDPTSGLPTSFVNSSLHRGPHRHFFARSQTSNVRKVSPVRPHIGGKPVVRSTSFSGLQPAARRSANTLSPGMKSSTRREGCYSVTEATVSRPVPSHGHMPCPRSCAPNPTSYYGPAASKAPSSAAGCDRPPRPISPAPLLNIPVYHQRSKEERKRKKSSEPLKITIPGEPLPDAARPIVPMAQVKPNNTMNIVGEVSIKLDRPAPATVTIHGVPPVRSPPRRHSRKSTRGEPVSNEDKRLLQQMLEATSPTQLGLLSPPLPASSEAEVLVPLPLPSPQTPALSPHSGQPQDAGSVDPRSAEKHSPALPSTLAAIRRRCTSNSREASPGLPSQQSGTRLPEPPSNSELSRQLLNSNSALASLLVANTIKPIGTSTSNSLLESVEGSLHSSVHPSPKANVKVKTPKSPKYRHKSPKSKGLESVDKEVLAKCSQVSAFLPTTRFSRKAVQKSRRSFFACQAFNFAKLDESKKFDIGKSIYYQCNVLGKFQSGSASPEAAMDSEILSPPLEKLESACSPSRLTYCRPEWHDEAVPSFNIPFTDWKDHLLKYKCQKLKMLPNLVYIPPKSRVPAQFEDLSPLVGEAVSSVGKKKPLHSAIDPVNSEVLARIRKKCPPTRKFGVLVERRPWVLEVSDTKDKGTKKVKRRSESLAEPPPPKQVKVADPEPEKPRIYLKITNGKITSTSEQAPSVVSTLCPADTPSVSSQCPSTPDSAKTLPRKQRYSLVRLEENFPSHMEEVRQYCEERRNNCPGVVDSTVVPISLERAVRATDALCDRRSVINNTEEQAISKPLPNIPQPESSSDTGDSRGKKRLFDSSSPIRTDGALANLVKRVKSQILGSAYKELEKKTKAIMNANANEETKCVKLKDIPIPAGLGSPQPGPSGIERSKPRSSPFKPCVSPDSIKNHSESVTEKKGKSSCTPHKPSQHNLKGDKVFCVPSKPASLTKLRSPRGKRTSPSNNSKNEKADVKSRVTPRRLSPRKTEREKALEEEQAREKERGKRRSLLDELANSDGYVAEKKAAKVCENLYADPSKLGREERALQRALMQFSEMQVRQDHGKEVKRAPKAQPPPPSQARQRARQLKKKAMQGSSKPALSRPVRRPIEFRPQRPATRLQAAAVDGKRSPRIYHKDYAYEKALDREEERRQQIRENKRRAGGQQINTVAGQQATPLTTGAAVNGEDKKKSTGFVFNWRSKYLGKSGKLSARKGVASKKSGAFYTAQQSGDTSVLSPEAATSQSQTGSLDLQDIHEKLDIPSEVKKLSICHNTGETILHKAARLGYKDVVLWCAQHNYVNVKERDNAGYSALHESCVSGHLDVARYLLEYGADVNVASRLDGVRPLHDAVENDHVELVRLLLSAGADPTLSTYSGKTVHKLARSRKMRQFLQAYLVDLNGPKGMDTYTAWEFGNAGREGTTSCNVSADCGFDLLAESPPDEEESSNSLQFEFSDVEPIQSYYLIVDEARGPENFLLLSEVLFRLNMSDSRLCGLHGALQIEHITWDEFTEKLQLSQIPLTPPEDLRPHTGSEMMDFVKLDVKLIELLGSDVETLPKAEGDVGCLVTGEANGGVCSPEAEYASPPVGSYISRMGSGDQSIRRATQAAPAPVHHTPTAGGDANMHTSPTTT